MSNFPTSLYLFDVSRFPEIDVTDLLEMRKNNQNKNTQRSTKKDYMLVQYENNWMRKIPRTAKLDEDKLNDKHSHPDIFKLDYCMLSY